MTHLRRYGAAIAALFILILWCGPPGSHAAIPDGETQEETMGHAMDHNMDHGSHMSHDPAVEMDGAAHSPGAGRQEGHGSHNEMNHGEMDHGAAPSMDHSNHAQMVMAEQEADPELARKVRVEERLGETADLEAEFFDESGKPVVLKELFGKPVVVLPVYFMCTTICNFLQAELANALNQVNALPGEDFHVISFSFSHDEDPALAHAAKRNYSNLLKRDIPLDKWVYLTGDEKNIRKFTDSLGYYFVRKKDHFYIHPNALVVLGAEGKIIRYLYGPNFLPFDLGMAVAEAEKGTPGISIKRGVLSFCFDYDPENKTYVFKMFRVTGTAILVLLAGFVYFLLRPGRRKVAEPKGFEADSKGEDPPS